MKLDGRPRHVYEGRVHPSGERFVFERTRPLRQEEVVLDSRGRSYRVAYFSHVVSGRASLLKAGLQVVVLLKQRSAHGSGAHRPRGKRTAPFQCCASARIGAEKQAANDGYGVGVIGDAGTALSAFPQQLRSELAAEIIRLADFWSKGATVGGRDNSTGQMS